MKPVASIVEVHEDRDAQRIGQSYRRVTTRVLRAVS
jgi:hypothetical protein